MFAALLKADLFDQALYGLVQPTEEDLVERGRVAADRLLHLLGAGLLQPVAISGAGSASSGPSTISLMDWCRYNASATTNHTTCWAGRRRRRMLALPAALNCLLDPFVRQMLSQPVPFKRRVGFDKRAKVVGQHGDES